jgi:tight adherence protein B
MGGRRIMLWLISLLFAVSFAGIAYVVFSAMRSGAQSYSDEYATGTARQLEDIFLFIPPHRINQMAWGTAAGVFIILFLISADITFGGIVRGLIIGLAGGGAALSLPRQIVRILKHQRRRRFNEQLVDSLGSMSNALRAGFSITQAFERVVQDGLNPISQEFAMFLQQIRVGIRFEDALINLEQRVESDDLTLMIRSIEIARLTGGSLTEVFDKIAGTIRERMRIEGRIRSLTAQGRLQGVIVGVMPVVLALILMGMTPEIMKSFLSSTFGIGLVVIVVIFEVLGALTIRKIVRIDV